MTLRSDEAGTTAQELSETLDTAAFKEAQRGRWKFRPPLGRGVPRPEGGI
jgi:hypothetical protein